MTATPTTRITVTFNYKVGTATSYQNVEFFPHACFLLFNGNNSNVVINPEDIDTISIDNEQYSIARVDDESGVPKVWLNTQR